MHEKSHEMGIGKILNERIFLTFKKENFEFFRFDLFFFQIEECWRDSTYLSNT